MKSFIARWGLLYPIHFLRGEQILLHRKEIAKLEKFTISEIHQWQQSKLSKLLKFAYQNDPYYKGILHPYVKFFDKPSSFFNQLPFLTKEIVREEELNRFHPLWSGLDNRSTSGSTGTPLSFWKDRLSTGYMQAVQDYAYGWHKLSVGEPQGRFWGMPSGKAGKIALLKDFLKNRIRFSAFNLNYQAKFNFYKRLLSFRPTYFYGYPSLILEFARFLSQASLIPLNLPLKVVIGTGEHVYQNEKDELERLLQVPFVEEYGCSEVGVIGFECQHRRLHVMAANIFLEAVDSNGISVPTGEEGEIVVTELNACHFPFVRYRLGDRGRLSTERCSCGQKLPILKLTSGRKDDYILTPEGYKVYDAIFAYTFKKGILQFKAIQDRRDRLKIYFRPDCNFSLDIEQEYRKKLQMATSPLMKIEFIPIEKIEREKSGKMRYFKSDIFNNNF